jgi:CRISPR/Cas system-associated exonuclease Cas4 (RecB family)
MPPSPTSWKLSPSDLTFLWDECPRCFYLKVVHGFARPGTVFPRIFSRIDQLMKDFFAGLPAFMLSDTLAEGVISFADRWVVSEPIHLPGHTHSVYIKGRFDSVIEFADGSYGVVDFKTSEPRPEHVPFYSRQLHAYAYALENPAGKALRLAPISRLGLLCVEPVAMSSELDDRLAYLGQATWLECPKDDAWFLGFIDNILSVLEDPQPPPPAESCAFCQYREQARQWGL